MIKFISKIIVDVNCYDNKDKSVTYNGTANTTEYGYTCENWNIYHYNFTNYYPNHNYCRNPRPDAFKRPWCYTGPGYLTGLCSIWVCGKCYIHMAKSKTP